MNVGPEGLPRWVRAEIAAGAFPFTSSQLTAVWWERTEDDGFIAYVFHVGGEKFTAGWLKSRGPEPA